MEKNKTNKNAKRRTELLDSIGKDKKRDADTISKQVKKSKEALKIIETNEFLRPILYKQDVELYNEKPETGGYIKGKYRTRLVEDGDNIREERYFVKGDTDEHTDYYENPTVTDISFDGYNLYVVDNDIGHYRVNDPERDPRIKKGLPEIEYSADDVEKLARDVSNKMEVSYTTSNPIFDVELGYLRTNFVSDTVAPYGNTMALRVSRPSLAIKDLTDMATPEVDMLIKVLMKTKTNVLISGSTGSGKSVADSQLVPTPKGLVRHGDLKVGDVVYDRLGNETKVLGVYPQGELEVYEVELKDGRKVKVSGDHHWLNRRFTHGYKKLGKVREEEYKVEDLYNDNPDLYYREMEIEGMKGWKVKTTEEIKEYGLEHKKPNGTKKYNFYLPNGGAIEKSEKIFKLHPYAMGAFLGDGNLTRRELSLSSADEFIAEKVSNLLGASNYRINNGKYDWVFDLPKDFDLEKEGYDVRTSLFQTRMFFNEKERGLCGTRSVPKEYFEGSIQQRRSLLKGLMDTDGTITKTGGTYPATFKTTSIQLAKDVAKLGRSLGMEMTVNGYPYELPERKGYSKEERERVAYHVRFNVPHGDKKHLFSLPRKLKLVKECEGKKQRRLYNNIAIVSINKLGYKENMQCILVDNKEHLYQLEDGVVTKNTEFQKRAVGYIPNNQKITLMEDTMDSHIKEIYPKKDINSWVTKKVEGDNNRNVLNVDFHELLRAALRNFPDWAIVSEVRGAEAEALLSVALSGHSVITTLHTRGAASIPERLADMVSMGDSKMDYGALLRNILSVFKIGIHLERDVHPETGASIRYIREIYEYVDYDEELGIIGYPLYRRYQEYDPKAKEYEVIQNHYRMSDDLIQKITDMREVDLLPSDFTRGDYEHDTFETKRKR